MLVKRHNLNGDTREKYLSLRHLDEIPKERKLKVIVKEILQQKDRNPVRGNVLIIIFIILSRTVLSFQRFIIYNRSLISRRRRIL